MLRHPIAKGTLSLTFWWRNRLLCSQVISKIISVLDNWQAWNDKSYTEDWLDILTSSRRYIFKALGCKTMFSFYPEHLNSTSLQPWDKQNIIPFSEPVKLPIVTNNHNSQPSKHTKARISNFADAANTIKGTMQCGNYYFVTSDLDGH